MAERTKVAAPGFAGGGDGGRGDVLVNGKRINNRIQHILKKGDTVLVRTPGGGGWASARDRDPDLVRRDRALGYVERRAGRRPGTKRRRSR
jgi:N-methylhydantoinase B/oxoprolinase/acetone carboxylase alpha subunit